jgi:hypothetical protein
MDEHISEEELKAHEAFMEEVRAAAPKQSCDMIRAWLKLNIEASMCPVWNN